MEVNKKRNLESLQKDAEKRGKEFERKVGRVQYYCTVNYSPQLNFGSNFRTYYSMNQRVKVQ